MQKAAAFVWLILLFLVNTASAMVYDNRFMPLYARNYSRYCDDRSALMFDGFIMTGRDAFADDRDIGIFEILGQYNQSQVAFAIECTGQPNPFDLPTTPISIRDLKNSNLIWDMIGKIQTQGLAFQYEHYIGKHISSGFSMFFMHLFSRNDFQLSSQTISDLELSNNQIIELDALRRQMNGESGLQAAKWSVAGFSDIDWYIRVGGIWDYTLKCRRIDGGVRAGALIPSGKVREITNPASIPFGGNGLWGFYVAGDIEIELKQDWNFGMLLRLNKRFGNTKNRRIPIKGEQPLYAPVVGEVFVEPGVTFIFSPYLRFEGIRDGFGIQGRYTLVTHEDDDLVDKRAVKEPPAFFGRLFSRTGWTSEYLTVNAFYDFAKMNLPFSYAPILSAKWDIPTKFFAAEDAAKTQRLSIGIIFRY